jgi:dissimilatory sulfite reductase (desulfoviridin) alpha/beta subunit
MNAPSAEELRTLKAQAMMVEKGGGRFSVRLSVTGGHLDVTQLQTIAALAERFGDGCVHLTTRQGVEIPHVPLESLAPLRCALDEAGLKLAAAGRCVRGITACPGFSCPRGLIDTQGLARRLHARLGGRDGLPHKFKIALSGCPNGCTKPKENDLGIMGRGKGFAVFVGGKMGKQPRWADLLPLEISSEDHLFRLVDAVIDWYAAQGQPSERFGATIERVGLEHLIRHLGGV